MKLESTGHVGTERYFGFILKGKILDRFPREQAWMSMLITLMYKISLLRLAETKCTNFYVN